MKIDIAGNDVSSEERRAIERRVLLALSRFGPELHRVAVSLGKETLNPLSGPDRRCRVRAWLSDGTLLRAEAIDETFESAASRVAAQLAQRMQTARGPEADDAIRRDRRTLGRPRRPNRR